jgi:hypothetical protein
MLQQQQRSLTHAISWAWGRHHDPYATRRRTAAPRIRHSIAQLQPSPFSCTLRPGPHLTLLTSSSHPWAASDVLSLSSTCSDHLSGARRATQVPPVVTRNSCTTQCMCKCAECVNTDCQLYSSPRLLLLFLAFAPAPDKALPPHGLNSVTLIACCC